MTDISNRVSVILDTSTTGKHVIIDSPNVKKELRRHGRDGSNVPSAGGFALFHVRRDKLWHSWTRFTV